MEQKKPRPICGKQRAEAQVGNLHFAVESAEGANDPVDRIGLNQLNQLARVFPLLRDRRGRVFQVSDLPRTQRWDETTGVMFFPFKHPVECPGIRAEINAEDYDSQEKRKPLIVRL